MKTFALETSAGFRIRFRCYDEDAPVTTEAFLSLLPLTRTIYHARVSGQEIWFDDLPALNIIQENASVFVKPGEVVLGPAKPVRVKTANCFGIYYGEGRGLDAANIFAAVLSEDMAMLENFGNRIWKEGAIVINLTLGV